MSTTTKKTKRNFLLIELLNSFSTQELEDFRHVVTCPYFNTDQFAIKLLNVLLKKVIHKKVFAPELQVYTYSKVFSNKENPKNLLNSKQKSFLAAKMNVLLRLAETFLCNEAMKKNAACRTELLFDILLSKNQMQLFKRNLVKEKKMIFNKNTKILNDYEHLYRIQYNELLYLKKNNLLEKEDNFSELNSNLDIFFILQKLSIYMSSNSHAKLYTNKKYSFDIMKALSSLLLNDNYTKHPLINLNLVAIELQNTSSEKKYYELISLLDIYQKKIAKYYLNAFYKIASNFCSTKIKEGNIKYYKEMFKIYKKRDEKELLNINGIIDIITFKNLIALSCKLKEYDWANKMIDKYIPFFLKEYQDSVYSFGKGLVAFYQSQFNEALKHFIRVEKIHIHYDIDCRIMILKSHYMLDKEYDDRTMRIFLWTEQFMKNAKKMAHYDKMAYKNFIRILFNIYKLKHKVGKASKEKINTKMVNLNRISDKEWLTQMLKQLPG